MKIGILGSGAGGCALAFDLSSSGHEVSIFDMPNYGENLEAIKKKGGIYSLSGDEEHFAKVRVEDNIQDILKSAEIVFVVTPSYGTKPFAEICKSHVSKGYKFVICPGSSGGALEFKQSLGLDLLDDSILVAETHTLPYAVRVMNPGYIHIYLYVKRLIFGVLPSIGNDVIYNIVKELWGDKVRMAKNVLETSLIDGNPVIHPPVTLMNAALIERTKGNFRFYADGITNSVARVMEAVDNERLDIARALGLELDSEPQMSYLEGYIEEGMVNFETGYSNSKTFEPIKAQDKLDHRYLTEDVGYVMVFWSTLAELLGVKIAAIDSIINLTSIVLGNNLKGMAPRTVQTLGITKELLKKL